MTLENFRRILSGNPGEAGTSEEALDVPYTSWYVNTLVISGATAFFSVFFGALAAYAFARFRFKGRRMGMLSLLLIQMFPTFLAVVASTTSSSDRRRLPGVRARHAHERHPRRTSGGALGVNTWLMKGFLDSIPDSLDESARVDGATPAQVFWGIILPLATPVLAVVGLLSYIFSINEFIIASRLLQIDGQVHASRSACTASSTTSTRSSGGPFCAGVVLAAIPVVVLFFFLQRFIVRGAHPRRGQGVAACARSSRLPHHDGSELYVPEPPTELGDEATVLLRVPRGVRSRPSPCGTCRDGEPQVVAATVDRETDADVWWRATFPVWNPATPYRWLLSGGDFGYAWLNGVGRPAVRRPRRRRLRRDAGRRAVPTGTSSRSSTRSSRTASRRPGARSTPPEWAIPRALGRAPDRARAGDARSSGSAATSSGSSSASTTSRRSARTSST